VCKGRVVQAWTLLASVDARLGGVAPKPFDGRAAGPPAMASLPADPTDNSTPSTRLETLKLTIVRFADLALPERDGFEFLASLRAAGSRQPVSPSRRLDPYRLPRWAQTLDQRFEALLGKPFTPRALIALVGSHYRHSARTSPEVGLELRRRPNGACPTDDPTTLPRGAHGRSVSPGGCLTGR
jgi:hypothetical protein